MPACRDHTAVRRLSEARSPELKAVEQLDWRAASGISEPTLQELASCDVV